MVKKQSKQGRSRSSLSDEETDSNMNRSTSKSNLNLRAYSSSPMNPSPVASSRFGSSSGLDLGFLSSTSDDISEGEKSAAAADDDVFFASRYSRPTTVLRERVRDRSLGRTSEKLYRKVNSSSSLRRTAFTVRSLNHPDNRRSRSVHHSQVRSQKFVFHNGLSVSTRGTTSERIIGKLLERKDQHISIEYMHITSSPLSSSGQEVPSENNNIPLGNAAMSSKNHFNDNVLRNSCQSEVLNVSIPVQRVEKHKVSASDNFSLWDGTDDKQHRQVQAKPDSHAVYLGGPEYKTWCSVRSAEKLYVLSVPRNQMKVTGMFKSVLNRYRQTDTAGRMQMPAKTVSPKDAEWGSGTLFLAASHSVANTNPSAFLSSQMSTRLNLVPRHTRSCFATPCRPSIELARKSGSSIEAKRRPFLKSKLQLTPFPRNVSLLSALPSITDSRCLISTNSSDESGVATNTTSSRGVALRNHAKKIEVQVRVDGQPKSVSFPFFFKSTREKPVVQVVEVLLDDQSIWRRKQSSNMNKEKKSSSANK